MMGFIKCEFLIVDMHILLLDSQYFSINSLSQVLFFVAGNSGYILKPEFLLSPDFDPYSEKGVKQFVDDHDPISLCVRILEARHLPVPSKPSSSLTCVVSMSSAPFDGVDSVEASCDSSKKNFLNPYFNARLQCEEIYMPELATLLYVIAWSQIQSFSQIKFYFLFIS